MGTEEDGPRIAPRERASIAAEVLAEGEDKPALGVLLDASVTGVRVITNAPLEEGDRVEIALQLSADERMEVAGVVARKGKMDVASPWRLWVGVKLDEPNERLAEIAADLAEQQGHS